jgi:predicted regulator of Ras-like GTPase activity (Roadblock/LC7/MglB family)
MNTGVETAFSEMLEISTDIQKALLYAPEGIMASNMDTGSQAAAVAQANELVRQGELRAADMESEPMTQLVVEGASGLVFLVREPQADGLVILATGKKGSRIGLALYDLKTCIRDARTALAGTEALVHEITAEEAAARKAAADSAPPAETPLEGEEA